MGPSQTSYLSVEYLCRFQLLDESNLIYTAWQTLSCFYYIPDSLTSIPC